MSKNPHWVASASILLASLIWGASFPVLRYLLEAGVQPLALIAARFAVGAAGLAVVLVLTRTRLDLRALVQGGVIGLVLAVGYWFQTDGIRFTTSSKAAFITGLFVLFTPLLSAMLGQPARGRHVAGALLAVAACAGPALCLLVLSLCPCLSLLTLVLSVSLLTVLYLSRPRPASCEHPEG